MHTPGAYNTRRRLPCRAYVTEIVSTDLRAIVRKQVVTLNTP